MNSFYTLLLKAHVLAGLLSLIIFWIPLCVKKGSTIHKKIGLAYVVTMSFVVLSAFTLSLLALATKRESISLPLLFLSLITAQPLLYGYLMAAKKEINATYKRFFTALATSIFLIGGYMVFLALVSQDLLYWIFGPLGLVSGLFFFRQNFRKSSLPAVVHHLQGMINSGGAAYTAFLVFGLRSFVNVNSIPSWIFISAWILPTLLANISVVILRDKYLKAKNI